MGGRESSGALRLDLASANIQAGDSISGTIHLVVTSATPALDLTITLSGCEFTEWTERVDPDSDCDSMAVRHSGQQALANQRLLVHRFNIGECVPGQYIFPFEIQTANTMLGSFSYQSFYVPLFDDSPMYAKVAYRLEASLEAKFGQIVPSVCEIIVTRPADAEIEPGVSTATAEVYAWYLACQGVSTLTVQCDKAAYVPGETATVAIKVDNSLCRLSATGIGLSLTRLIEVRDRGGHARSNFATLNSDVMNVAVEAGACVGPLTMSLVIPSDRDIENATSIDGSLIHCEYTMTVEVKLGGWLSASGERPRVARTIVVYPQAGEKLEVEG